MGHTKSQDLTDLSRELAQIRELEGLKEKSPGIFYYKAIGFLHFHDKDGKRWADIKAKDGWQELAIDCGASAVQRKVFLSQVKKAHKTFLGGKNR